MQVYEAGQPDMLYNNTHLPRHNDTHTMLRHKDPTQGFMALSVILSALLLSQLFVAPVVVGLINRRGEQLQQTIARRPDMLLLLYQIGYCKPGVRVVGMGYLTLSKVVFVTGAVCFYAYNVYRSMAGHDEA